MTKSTTDKPAASAAHGDWCLYSAGLYMRADTTDAGRLVRLADVVRWVMYRGELPIVDSVESVCAVLESARPAPALFMAVEHLSASPVAPDNSFGFFTAETLARAKRFVEPIARGESIPMHPIKLEDHAPSQFQIRGRVVTSRETAQEALEYLNGEVSKPVQPGAPAAAQYMRDFWAIDGWGAYVTSRDWPGDETLDKRELKTCGLSVSVADAARVWGWGRAAESASQPEEAPQAAAPEPKAAPEWQELARSRAREIIKEHKARDLFLPQERIAEMIATEFRRDGIMGSDGKPLSGASIKRHALKGISSAQDKQLSTSPRRGK